MKSTLITILIAAALVAPHHLAQAAGTAPENKLVLGVEDCVRIALKAAPELGEAQADIDLTTSKLDEASSNRYPQLSVTSLFGPAPRHSGRTFHPLLLRTEAPN